MSNTVAFIPSSLSTRLSQMPVSGIYVAAQPPDLAAASEPGQASSGTQKTNHWVLYLITSPQTSVRFDLSPTGTGSGVLIISNLDYVMSSDVVKVYTLSIKEGISVQSVLETIQQSGYDRYSFTGGQGIES